MVTCEDTSLADAAADPRGAGARDSLPRPWLRKRWWRGVLRLPSMREMWTMSLLVMSVLLISTYFVRNLTGATVVITLMGLPWAVTMWVPFALVGEFVSLMSGETIEDMAISIQDINSGGRSMSPSLSPAGSRGETSVMDSTDISPHLTPVLSRMSMYNKRSPSLPHHNYHQNDNMPMAKSLLAADANLGRVESQESSTSHIGARRYSAVNHEPTDGVGPDGHPSSTPTTEYDDLISATNTTTNTTDSGVYLGIHNMYIVFPQFAINAISSIVFAILSPDSSASNVHGSLPHVHQPHPSSSSSSSSPSSPPLPQLASLLSSSSPQSSFNIERIDMLLLRVIVGYYQVRRQQNGGGASAGHDAVGWVLRIGGLSAFVSAVLSLFVMNRKQVFDYINSA
ncbi:hypothetical protein EV182_005725 [Spiromyces aspiralis]|uniref:Uncharacterized protein n=1 Tax=Spiromyces aspiralis TaxID=68401 RepID=A0ACC1HMH0_9FUNG|nr:hypothetical protein EV182_005725 [Spiromyces aspiralis]